MKKRIASILLCMILSAISLFAGFGTVHADGDVEVSTEVTGMVHDIGGKLFVPPMGVFNVVYKVQNNSSKKITIVEAVENLKGSNEDFPIELNGGVEVRPGDSASFPGKNFDGELANNPNVVKCRVHYLEQGDDQEVEEAVGQASVNVMDTSMNVVYTSPLQGPVFKGEQAALKVEVESRANITLYNLVVIDSDLGKTLGNIDVLAPGQIQTIEPTVPLEKSTKGNISIEYDDPLGGEKLQSHFDTDLEIEVKQEAPVSSLTITGKPDKNLIPGPGQESVTFELKIKNTGNTVLKHLECLDWEGKVFYTYEQLLPGEEIPATYTGNVKPDTPYALSAQARVEDTTQQIQSSYAIQLKKLNPQVEIERTVVPESVKAGEPFTLEYVIRNTGNVDLVDVVIEEPDFGEIDSFDKIAAGQEVESSKELTIDEDAVSRTILKAKDAETDGDYSYEASELEIPIGGGGSEQKLSVELTSDKNFLNKPGTVEMECVIENTGKEPLYNMILTLMEREMAIDNLSVLEPGEKKTIKVTPFRVEETEAFLVEVNGLDADGEKFTVKSEPLTIEVGKGGLSGKDTLLRVVLIVIILLCVLVIGALVYMIKGSGKFRFPFRRKRKVTGDK